MWFHITIHKSLLMYGGNDGLTSIMIPTRPSKWMLCVFYNIIWESIIQASINFSEKVTRPMVWLEQIKLFFCLWEQLKFSKPHHHWLWYFMLHSISRVHCSVSLYFQEHHLHPISPLAHLPPGVDYQHQQRMILTSTYTIHVIRYRWLVEFAIVNAAKGSY